MYSTFASPQATVYIDNEIVGFMQNVQFNETITQNPVRGMGDMLVQEFVATAYDCQFSGQVLFIGFDTPWFKKILNRLGSVDQIIDTLSLIMNDFSIVVYKKDVQNYDEASKLVTSVDKTGKTIMKAAGCVLENVTWEITQGGIATSNFSGRYRTPFTIQ